MLCLYNTRQRDERKINNANIFAVKFIFLQRILLISVFKNFFLNGTANTLYDSTLQFIRYLIIFQNGISHVSRVHEFTALMILLFLDAHL